MGDSRGHWEGNTLVVETTNFTDRTGVGVQRRRRSRTATALKIIERFTRIDADTHRVQGHGRRPGDVDAAVDDRVAAGKRDDELRDLRIRVPRRQLRAATTSSSGARADERAAAAAAPAAPAKK